MKPVEIQIDRVVGPTHHFGGLGGGNLASHRHAGHVAHPAAAALQGLDKMRLVAELGVPQRVLPPQRRTALPFLRSVGFEGTDADVLRRAADEAPRLLSAAMSSSAMWTANAATVSPAVDNRHGRLIVTVANLEGNLHRALEPEQTQRELRRVLPPGAVVRPPLGGGAAFRDEGAANHMRLGPAGGGPGLHLFVYGDGQPGPTRFWPRQTLASCQALARLHGIPPENAFFLKQHPRAIDAGAFHNDVVATSHDGRLFYHQYAYHQAEEQLERIDARYRELTSQRLQRIEVPEDALTIDEAVATYLFNSQIVTPAGEAALSEPVLICPQQVREHPAARKVVDFWHEQWFAEVRYVDLHESMSGGGGPACLRLRVPVDADEVAAAPGTAPPSSIRTPQPGGHWSQDLDQRLRERIRAEYPETVSFADLGDLELVRQMQHAEQRIRSLLT